MEEGLWGLLELSFLLLCLFEYFSLSYFLITHFNLFKEEIPQSSLNAS